MKFLHPILLFFSLALLASFTSNLHADNQDGPVFRHFVAFQFKKSATDEDIQRIVDEFMLLKEKIDTIQSIEWGFSENIEPLNDDFTHAFLVTFKDKSGLETYLPHPSHEAFKKILKPHLKKVFVFDYSSKD